MSLWLAFLWLAFGILAFGIFVLCRQRLADIGQQVADEIDHRIRSILKAEREIDQELLQALVAFENPREAISRWQKAQSEIAGIPPANPPWTWSADQLDRMRKACLADETAHRVRRPVVASILSILVLTLASAVVTVVLSNSAKPVLATTAGQTTTIRQPSAPWPPAVNLPTLPSAIPPPVTDPNGIQPQVVDDQADSQTDDVEDEPAGTTQPEQEVQSESD